MFLAGATRPGTGAVCEDRWAGGGWLGEEELKFERVEFMLPMETTHRVTFMMSHCVPGDHLLTIIYFKIYFT